MVRRSPRGNDFVGDLNQSFYNYSLFLNMKKTIQKKYEEACKMANEKMKDFKVVDLFMSVEEDLKKDGFSGQVVAVSFDSHITGSVECVQQYVLCSDDSSYQRFICRDYSTKFKKASVPGGK